MNGATPCPECGQPILGDECSSCGGAPETAPELRQLEAVARAVGRQVGPAFARAGALFAVLGFIPGEGGWATYTSNADRESMVKALREMADHLEARADAPALDGRSPT